MSIPNSPLLPGSKLEQAAKSRSTFSIAAFIFSAHVAVFLVVLLNGCNKESTTTATTDPAAPSNQTDLAVQPLSPPPGTTDPAVPPGAETVSTNPPTAGSGGIVTFPGTPANVTTSTPPQVPDLGAGLTTGAGPTETLPQGAGSATSEYKVKSGDIAYNIAKANGVSLKALKDANPNIDLGKLRVGQVLQVPAGGATKATPKSAGAAEVATEAAGTSSGSSYTVKGGDTLGRIAKKNGVSIKALRAANNLSSDKINVGQKLKIPAKGGTETPAPAVKTPAEPIPAAPVPLTPPSGTGR
jgi:LysM repeat protein